MSVEISCNIVVIAANLIVGARLLKQGVARKALPELLLGGAFAFDGIEWLLWMLAFYTPLAGTPLADYLAAGCRAGIAAGILCLLLFVRTVFRPTSRATLAFALLASAIHLTGLAVGIYLGDWTGFAADRIWLWLELGATQAAYAWCFAEAARYYAQMRKRRMHGLADPIVTNRILLWSGYGACGMLTQALYMIGAAIAGTEGSYPFILDALMIVVTTLGALLIVLAFFPAPAYTRGVAGGSTAGSDSR